MNTMSVKKTLKKIDSFLDRQTTLFLSLFLLVILRIPNFFEPYWYGDEAIYLAVGNALNKGGKLYTTIIDHKTPLIYQFARVPNQFYFRLLNLLWIIMATIFFYLFAKKLFKKEMPSFIATIIMVLLSTLPWLEGNIPNGELFVLGFVMLASFLFTQTKIWQNFFAKTVTWPKKKSRELLLLFGSGTLFSLGILTKVPALLDLVPFFAIFALLLLLDILKIDNKFNDWKKTFNQLLWRFLSFSAGIVIPILLSIIYYQAIGSGKDYLDYGLLYNLRYSQSWSPSLNSAFMDFSFSLLGKTIYFFSFLLLITLNIKELNRRFQFISIWFVATLYAVLLSNRPYPHYFIQMVPPLSLLLVEIGSHLTRKKSIAKYYKSIVAGLALIFLTIFIMLTLNFKPYSTIKYYSQFWRMASGQISKTEYDYSFNNLMKDNQQLATLIEELGLEKIFIWGDNAMLYAQSKTVPTSRFTMAFHIKDFADYERTLAQIKQDEPKLIVVMKNDQNTFPALNLFLKEKYLINSQFDHVNLFLKK
jgi:4-amino-4-deoxy-L-arabinose transferase-like glycosyltransferase